MQRSKAATGRKKYLGPGILGSSANYEQHLHLSRQAQALRRAPPAEKAWRRFLGSEPANERGRGGPAPCARGLKAPRTPRQPPFWSLHRLRKN